jgi:hypothetical protein
MQYQFWEPITYLDSEEKFPSTKEKLGRWVGVAHNVGDFFCWKIYDETTEVIIERSVIASRLKNPNLAAEAEFKRMTTPPMTGETTRTARVQSTSAMKRYRSKRTWRGHDG